MIQALPIPQRAGNGQDGMDFACIGPMVCLKALVHNSAQLAVSKRWNVLPIAAASGVFLLALGSSMAHRPLAVDVGSNAAAALMPVTTDMVVGRGGSLWQFARQYGDPNVSLQERVDALAELNGLKAGAPLVAGQKLLVPVANPAELARRQVLFASR